MFDSTQRLECPRCKKLIELTQAQAVQFERSIKTVKIAMRELIDLGFEVFLLQHHVFDIIASSTKEVRYIKTVYTEESSYNTAIQRDRLAKFYKYPKFVDETNMAQHRCFKKELWVRGDTGWKSKITIN